MQQLIRRPLDGVVACIAHSTRADGDLSPSNVEPVLLAERRARAVAADWHAVHQVHSDRVIRIDEVIEPSAERPRADALITSRPGLALAVHSGDCIPVGFVSDGGAVAAAHAGWKGLEAGVLESTVRALRAEHSDASIIAAVGPHIRKHQYEFGEQDLARLAQRFGSDVVATTATGSPALDLTAAVTAELARLGLAVEVLSPDCTATDDAQYWSHRARQERGRIALVAWLERSPS